VESFLNLLHLRLLVQFVLSFFFPSLGLIVLSFLSLLDLLISLQLSLSGPLPGNYAAGVVLLLVVALPHPLVVVNGVLLVEGDVLEAGFDAVDADHVRACLLRHR
jgi:hypothetical protein